MTYLKREIKELNLIRNDLKINEKLFHELLDPVYLAAQFEFMNKFDKKASWETVKKAIKSKLYKLKYWEYLQNSAAIIGAISIAAWLYFDKPWSIPMKNSDNRKTYISNKIQFNICDPVLQHRKTTA